MHRLTLIVMLGVIALDQATKWLFVGMLEGVGQIVVTSFFNLTMVWNHGVSFGLFSDKNARWLLVGVALAITLLVLYWDRTSASRYRHLASGLIAGGAIGNIIDRLYYGAVADFFDVHLHGYHWPAFNIADSCIVAGVALWLTQELFAKQNDASELPHADQER